MKTFPICVAIILLCRQAGASPIDGRLIDCGEDQTVPVTKVTPKQCDPKYKGPSLPGTHTACIDPSSDLVEVIPITRGDQDDIVEAHNKWRKDEHAENMLEVTWDTELAMLAEKWASTCPFGHDKGPLREAIGRFKTGQNIYYTTSSSLSFYEAVKAWDDEKKDFTYDGKQRGIVGHYTQVVWAQTFKVGCAGVKCKNVKFPTIFICNYGPAGNVMPNQYKPFVPGSECSACPGHCKNGLCDCGGKTCANDGELNLSTCKCSCQDFPWYEPDNCKLECSKAVDKKYCPQYGKSACPVYSNVPHECPKMCGKC